MSKPIPTNKAVKDALAVFISESEARGQRAKAIYHEQNVGAREAIDRMQSILIRVSRRSMRMRVEDTQVIVEIPNDAIWNNTLYMAVELLKDLAYMDIRVADFRWPDVCMDCGGSLRLSKKVK
jgi:hypothetical protein